MEGGRKKEATPGQILTCMTHILESKHCADCPSQTNIGKAIDSLQPTDQHVFFEAFNPASHHHGNGGGDKNPAIDLAEKFISKLQDANIADKNRLRKALGVWYSSVLLADLCACSGCGESVSGNADNHLHRRIKAIVEEALAWCPGAIAAEVLIKEESDQKRVLYNEGFGAIGETEDDAKNKATLLRSAIHSYAKEHGTTAELKLHLRSGHRIETFKKGMSRAAHKDGAGRTKCELADIKAIHPCDVQLLEAKPIRSGDENLFFKKMRTEIGETSPNVILHIASGADVAMHGNEYGKESLVHLYVLLGVPERSHVTFPRDYTDSMDSLLHRLVHYCAVKKLMDARAESEKIMQRLHKRDQMLSLLESPLNGLTEAVGRMQKDTQRLRAVLYEPAHAMFAAAPRIAQYFEENREIRWGEIDPWKATHKPQDEHDVRVLRCSLAAIICEIFGETDFDPINEGALWGYAEGCLIPKHSGSDAFSSLRELCRTVLSLQAGDLVGKDDASQSDATIKSRLQSALGRIKDALFRPYKDGDRKYPLLPLALVVYDIFDKAKITARDKAVDEIITGSAIEAIVAALQDYVDRFDYAPEVFRGMDIPVTRYAHWLAFLRGILSYAKNERSAVSVDCTVTIADDGTEISIEFFQSGDGKLVPCAVYDVEKMSSFWREMTTWIGKGDKPNKGNFEGPFTTLMTVMVPGSTVQLCSCQKNHPDKVMANVVHERWKTTITLEKTKLTWKTGQNDRRE